MIFTEESELDERLSAARKPDVIGDLDASGPISSGAFDLIVSSYVLEHLRKPRLFSAKASALSDMAEFSG